MKYFLAVFLSLGLSLGLGLAVRQERAGFSLACQGVRTIGQMTRSAQIVTEALVVDVSPARDNVYAVTLQVSSTSHSEVVPALQKCLFADFEHLQGKTKGGRATSWTSGPVIVFETKNKEEARSSLRQGT